MNFRCDLSCQEAKDYAASNDLRSLVNSDQLFKAKDGDDLLYRFHEDPITFLPSFKYDKNSEVYDTSKKQRTPSYTDRILVSMNEGSTPRTGDSYQIKGPDIQRSNGNQFSVEYYCRRESTFSDHRPVLGVF